MSVLLFHLRDVPDDEAEAVRELLEAADIPYYETSAGSWKISVPAIWLRDRSRLAEARALIDAYEQQRAAEHAHLPVKSWQSQLQSSPLRFLVYLAIIGAILYFSLEPFIQFGG